MPRSRPSRPQSSRVAPASFSASSTSRPQNCGFFQPTAQPQPGLDGGDVHRQVLPVQRVAHLGAQGVARAETAGPDAMRRTGLEDRVPQGGAVVPPRQQLVAALPGVAGPAHHHGRAAPVGLRERHVAELVVTAGQAELGEHLVAARALHGQDAEVLVQVADLDSLGRGRGQPAHHLGRVRRVGDEEHLVVAAVVGDQVVHHAAGRVVAAQRVLRLAGVDAAEVVGQRRVHVLRRTRSAHHGLAEMADVEHPHRLAHGQVLLDHTAAGILDRHRPAAEIGHLRAQVDVALVQRRSAQVGHAPGR